MRTITRFALVCAVLLSGLQAKATEQIRWSGSLTDALVQAKKVNKLVMVDFYSDSCVWCRRLDKDVYPDPRVVNAAKNILMVKLNVEDSRQGTAAATKYNVTKLPTILFLKPDGSTVHASGYMPPKEFSEDMQHAVDIHKNLPIWQAKFKSNPKDSANARQLAKTWLEAGRLPEAEQVATALAKNSPKDRELSMLYNMLGQNYAQNGNITKAQTLFVKALASAEAPMDKAFANFSLGICAMTRKDKVSAKGYLTKASSTPGAPEGLKKKAQQILDMIAKS
ncbi:hypothetical protein LBMAG21_15780 [Armatimonadota bacterium]|nr:hypothetical protein LBMAG21_15780 [Armatimonadota bacterium]